jgi:hypothetical protein
MRTKRGDVGLLRFIITVIRGALDYRYANCMFIIRFIKGALDIAKSIDFYTNFSVSCNILRESKNESKTIKD